MFRFFCPECGNKLKAPESLVGQHVECAHCGNAIPVPMQSDVQSAVISKTGPQSPKTQEISRKALVDHSTMIDPEPENLVDMINKQVDAEQPLPTANAAVPIAHPVAAPAHPVAAPVEMPAPPTAHAEPTQYRAGMVVGNFEIGYLLGQGAMGQVFAAKQLSMDRQVALKILPLEIMSQDADAVDQFNNEVKMLAKLDHHNIVTAFEAGEDKGIYYLAMAFITGSSLEEVLEKEGIIGEEQSLNLIIHVANALKYAWDRFNMLHQDIKPGNIMIDEHGDVKLMDMGIAKISTKKEKVSGDTFVLGTPHYMSPEQAAAKADLDWRSDQYALGCTLYRMLTGELPFAGDDPSEVMKQHLSTPVRPPKSLNATISDEVNDLVKRMLAKNRDRRFSSWDELISSLSEISHLLSRRAQGAPQRKATDKNRPAKPQRKRRKMSSRGGRGPSYAQSRASVGKFLAILFGLIGGLLVVLTLMYMRSKQ